MKKFGKVLFLFCFILVTMITGCRYTKKVNNDSSDEQQSSQQQEEKAGIQVPKRTNGTLMLVLGYSTNSADPRGVASQQFQKEVWENTNGTVQIEIYPNSQKGGDDQLIASVMSGTIDMTVSSAGNFTGYVKNEGISALPFLFDTFELAWKFMDSDLVATIDEELLDYNIHVLSHFDNGFRCVTTTNTPVNKPEDLNGLRIRTPSNAVVQETMSELGADPVSLEFSKLKEALTEGKFDAQENPVPIIYNNQLYEEQNYLSITNHSYDAMPFVISQMSWNQMTHSEREVVQQAAIHAQEINRELVRQQTQDDVLKLETEGGMIVLYPDLEPFKEKTRGVADFFKYDKTLLEQVETILQQ